MTSSCGNSAEVAGKGENSAGESTSCSSFKRGESVRVFEELATVRSVRSLSGRADVGGLQLAFPSKPKGQDPALNPPTVETSAPEGDATSVMDSPGTSLSVS